MNTSDLQFNIIFTPHTVEYLSPFIQTLLKWTDCRYQLVANGCSQDDRQLLQLLCSSEDRLDYAMVSDNEMLEHGRVLNYLRERTDSDWFCFMDSDILATGPFIEALAKELNDTDLFATGHPLWYAPEDISIPKSFRRLHGIHFQTSDGRHLGGTYFAVYKNQLLSEVMDESGMDFRVYRWEDIPSHHQQTLRELGLEKIEYDTGLVLTCLLHAKGARIRSVNMHGICHLGGVSAQAGDAPARYCRGLLDKLATRLFGGTFSAPLFYLADSWYGLTKQSPGVSMEETRELPFRERRIIQSRVRKRIATAHYFNALLRQLLRGGKLPQPPLLGYAPAEQRIAKASTQIKDLYDELNLSGSDSGKYA